MVQVPTLVAGAIYSPKYYINLHNYYAKPRHLIIGSFGPLGKVIFAASVAYLLARLACRKTRAPELETQKPNPKPRAFFST